MDVQPLRPRSADPGDDSDSPPPIDPATDERTERLAAWSRLNEYAAGAPAPRSVPAAAPAPTGTLPFARFSPSAGLTIDRTGSSVVISGTMELSGESATPERAQSIEQSINTMWTHTFDDGHSVRCNVSVRYRPPGSSPGNVTQITAEPTLGPSKTDLLGRRDVTLNAREPDAFTWAAAHEFGHVIGLDDRYTESLMSHIAGALGGDRSATAHPGYAGNVMADSDGTLGSQNVDDIATENEPNPLWINDDDQVRDWISSHPDSEIAALTTADKLRAISVLQSGWVSDEDMQAIGRVCASVTSHVEAEAIRSGVDPLDLSDLGQRTQLRLFFARMP